jgi:hypothetical protein
MTYRFSLRLEAYDSREYEEAILSEKNDSHELKAFQTKTETRSGMWLQKRNTERR